MRTHIYLGYNRGNSVYHYRSISIQGNCTFVLVLLVVLLYNIAVVISCTCEILMHFIVLDKKFDGY